MQTTIPYIQSELKNLYPESEIQAFTRIILESVCGWDYTQQILKRNEILAEEDRQKIKSIVARLKNAEPLQYILGETEFYGLKLDVNPSVLIPRPETEELVQWILESTGNEKHRILDVGTGSGCIALALKKGSKSATVSGVDISESALETARKNALKNNLEVEFFQSDMLDWESKRWNNFDVIVSNPPYVRQCEKVEMKTNVLDHEPENALFVSNENPLVFYRSISLFAKKYLPAGGFLFFEINENFGEEIRLLLEGFEFQDIQIRKDLNHKIRMACCRK